MHPAAVEAVVASVQRRAAQGDHPTEPPQPREVLEEVIVDLVNARLSRKIRNDPADEPTAGGPSDTTQPSLCACDPPYREGYECMHPHLAEGLTCRRLQSTRPAPRCTVMPWCTRTDPHEHETAGPSAESD